MARAWSAVSLAADIVAQFWRNYAQRPVKARGRRARSAIAAPSTKDRMSKKPIIPFSPSEEDYLPAGGGRRAAGRRSPTPTRSRSSCGWLEEALKKEPNDANAMTLATVDADGLPDARMVLLKGVDERGFTFFTNFESAKGRELLAHPEGGAGVPLEVACAGRCGCAARSRR